MLLRSIGLGWLAMTILASLGAAQTSGEGSIGKETENQATIGEEGDGHFGFQLGFYNHSDSPGDGNPFLDEALTVIEPVIVYDYNINNRLKLGAILSYDLVSSASIERLNDHPRSEQSGASGDNYIGVDFSLLYQKSRNWTIGGHAGYSIEYDYRSIGLGVGATQDLEDADANLSYNIDAYLDSIDIIRFDGTQSEGGDNRTSVSGSVNWYQILSPTSHGTFGLTMAQQNGFLETPYNSVIAEGSAALPEDPPLHNGAFGREQTEELPDSRTRLALFGRVRNSFGRGKAYELGGRLYSDTWGINSVAIEPRYYFSLIDDKLDWRLRYRFYTQTAADDFQEHFTEDVDNLPAERTQDSDLAAFDAHTFGSKWTLYSGLDDNYYLSVDYTMRSDGLDYLFAAIGWSWSF